MLKRGATARWRYRGIRGILAPTRRIQSSSETIPSNTLTPAMCMGTPSRSRYRKTASPQERRSLFLCCRIIRFLLGFWPVAPEPLVGGHPVSIQHGGGQGCFPCQNHRRTDFCELQHLAFAVATQHLQRLPLGSQTCATSAGSNDERR